MTLVSQWYWIDALGVRTCLSKMARITLDPIAGKGVYAPPFSLDIEKFSDGKTGYYGSVQTQARKVDLPIQIIGTTNLEVETQIRNLGTIFNPHNGTGQLLCTKGKTRRILNCRYYGGLEMLERTDPFSAKGLLSFVAADPYWYDELTTTNIYTINIAQAVTFFPIFPLRLYASSVFTSVTVTNLGDETTYPVWTIIGPGSDLVLENITLGQSLGITKSLSGTSNQIIINTKPGIKTIVDETGASLYANLVTGKKYLWPLLPGDNLVTMLLTSATVDSQIRLQFQNRYVSY